MTDAKNIASKLAALQLQFNQQLIGKLDELKRCVTNQTANITRPLLVEIHSRLHKLAGSAGTFGFTELSQQTRQLEITAQNWLDTLAPPSAEDWSAWQQKILCLSQTLHEPVNATAILRNTTPALREDEQRLRIALIENDASLGDELMQGLQQFGYEVTCYSNYRAAETGMLTTTPDMLVADFMMQNTESIQGHDAVSRLFCQPGSRLPIIYLSSHTDFDTRLAAARAEVDAFVSKPVDISILAGHIDRLFKERSQSPFRVLIVDDDEMLAEHYRLVLTAAGMLAEKETLPRNVLDAINHLNPDLLLLDLHMPDCSGTELARAIRYESDWLGLPIVFLSAENDLYRQIEALGSGADDFLTKPISDVRLVAAVRARAARARKVADLMNQDSLTGLLKHASIKDRLQQEVDRSQRQKKPLAVVMIDIDHFKKVNDNWGHPMGDKVIKTLSQLLRQRMRRQDSIGRYGGEEFAAVLPECSVADAKEIIEDIRQRMAAMHFTHDGENFSVTISAGIASTERYFDAAGLLAAADAALYNAKHAGRNQVASL